MAWLLNAITPLNAYFALIVSFAAKYQKDASVGAVVAPTLLYVVALFVIWPLLLDLAEFARRAQRVSRS
jgi:aminobenzoyl-glutamate transport protein